MFRLDQQIFKLIYDNCKFIGEGLGMTIIEGAIINFTIIAGVILIAINNKGAKK